VEIADVARIRAAYDQHRERTRVVTLLSPTCTVCQYGQGVVRGIFEVWEDLPLHGLVIWVPMLPDDTAEAAEAEAAAFSDPRIEHFWDAERALANAFAGVLDLRCPAWDVYLVYRPGVRWGDTPAPPTSWMLQLPEQVGADPTRLLDAGHFAAEVRAALSDPRAEPCPDLALRLHAKGLATVKENRSGD
jgi:hypothetical protein